MSCSQEFVQAQLDERRRTADHLHLLQTATHTQEERVPSRPRSLLTFTHRAIHRALAWLSASQLGPLPEAHDTLDPDHRRH